MLAILGKVWYKGAMLLADDIEKELYYVFKSMKCTNYTLYCTTTTVRPMIGYDSKGVWGIYDDWPEDAEFGEVVELIRWKDYPESHHCG